MRQVLPTAVFSSWSFLLAGVTPYALAFSLLVLAGCSGGGGGSDEGSNVTPTAESCMSCHNGGFHNDYGGGGLENPHPFPGAATIACSTCHGGAGGGITAAGSHVPPPPEIGDEANQVDDAQAYFNRLTLTGIDKFPDYEVNGKTYTALDYLQFLNPGDMRVVIEGRGCGQCHMSHAECVAKSPLATEAGLLSGAMFAIGVENTVPESVGRYEDTAADLAFRAVEDPNFIFDPTSIGGVPRLREFPVFSVRDDNSPEGIFENQLYNAFDLVNDRNADNSVVSGSPLANLFHEQVAFTCGDCHLGSAGANNRYGDFRSSGCTACHMQYALDGRSTSTDPNIRKFEPFDPDDIEAPERPHVKRHMIQSVSKVLPGGEAVEGISDYACAGCHQGSNRTVMQYWGIRLDQNQDVRRGNQYPAQPDSFRTTSNDERLFDPVVNNNTFNGRNRNQYLLEEDYDGDGRDDTPPDVHYEAGLGCIDCHGSHDLHGGTVGAPGTSGIPSRQEQAVAIRCESCHGSVDAYATVSSATTYTNTVADCAQDSEGNPLKHVIREAGGYFLYSRLTGKRHYVPQTRDVVVDNSVINPFTEEPVFNIKASYAMGRADGDPSTGFGPQQTGGVTAGFSHTDNMSCVSCHASWTNNCIGCHLEGEYNNGNNFSNITGEKIVFREAEAQFVYQSPVPFSLGIDAHNKISPMAPNTETFFRYRDLNGDRSQVFAFSDRKGKGNNPGDSATPSLAHNAMMPHSIRGKVSSENEGPRYCVSCHLTTEAVTNFGAQYDAFRTAINTADYGALDFNLLQVHIGQNTGNQLNSPFFVHMAAGLGSGLFLFDEHGCPVNPLDENDNRYGCDEAPADVFDPARVALDLDRMVLPSGKSTGSNTHALLQPGVGPNLRDGADNPNMSGPMGATLIQKLTDPTGGIILDSWIDANGMLQGDAGILLGI